MRHLMALAAVALLALPGLTGSARAATPFERIRGTVETVDPDTMTVKTADGAMATVALTKDTKITAVVKSSLGAITDGCFVGTATKGDNPPVALEVHIFPESMRGANEGFRDWDMIPDTLAGGLTKSAMTNGTVKTGAAPLVKSAMTNGTVSAQSAASGDKMLTLNYGNGEKRVIAVTPRTPIVAYELADRSMLQSGAKIFVLVTREGDKLTALRAAIGKDGLTPPM